MEEAEVTVINKVVNIRNKELLAFMFPDFRVYVPRQNSVIIV